MLSAKRAYDRRGHAHPEGHQCNVIMRAVHLTGRASFEPAKIFVPGGAKILDFVGAGPASFTQPPTFTRHAVDLAL
ncbi:MAG: hypothetical protein NZ739_07795 [Verrucomicrobiae bacterium]|nr:hypothetical protein [Verrucomicrobiae bacterium]MDW7979572.1 hypothetical protein [Verrucomicrobiales bacterium]